MYIHIVPTPVPRLCPVQVSRLVHRLVVASLGKQVFVYYTSGSRSF